MSTVETTNITINEVVVILDDGTQHKFPDLLTAVVTLHGQQRLIDHVAEQFGVRREELANKLVPVFYGLRRPERMRQQ